MHTTWALSSPSPASCPSRSPFFCAPEKWQPGFAGVNYKFGRPGCFECAEWAPVSWWGLVSCHSDTDDRQPRIHGRNMCKLFVLDHCAVWPGAEESGDRNAIESWVCGCVTSVSLCFLMTPADRLMSVHRGLLVRPSLFASLHCCTAQSALAREAAGRACGCARAFWLCPLISSSSYCHFIYCYFLYFRATNLVSWAKLTKKYILNLNLKHKAISLPKENIGEKSQWPWVRQIILS